MTRFSIFRIVAALALGAVLVTSVRAVDAGPRGVGSGAGAAGPSLEGLPFVHYMLRGWEGVAKSGAGAKGGAGGATLGSPLKGVDVKLGKNPGGSPAARTTGVLPGVILQECDWEADETGTAISTFAVGQVGTDGKTLTLYMFSNQWAGAARLSGTLAADGYEVRGDSPDGAGAINVAVKSGKSNASERAGGGAGAGAAGRDALELTISLSPPATGAKAGSGAMQPFGTIIRSKSNITNN